MKQALHIFAKDIRHFWPEIAISVAVTGLFAWLFPYTWRHGPGTTEPARLLYQLSSLAIVLMAVSWWLPITRVIQAESLVGDRQWWVTKPYEWQGLLGAKVLFIAAFVLGPFLAAECVLIEVAGFHWYACLPGLALQLVMLFGFLVGPLLALAAVTSGFGKTTLTLLAVLVVFILVAALGAMMDTGSLASYGDNAGGFAAFLLIAGCGGAAIVLQYARRMSWLSRLLLASVWVPLVAAMWLSSTPQLIAMAYPAAKASFHVAMDLSPGRKLAMDAGAGRVTVTAPLVVTGVDGGTAVRVDGVRATLVTQTGKRWTSRWEPIYGQLYFPGGVRAGLPLQVDRKFYESAESQPVRADLVLAVTKLKSGEDRVVPMSTGEMSVPGVGICWVSLEWGTGTFRATGIDCRTPMREPPETYVNVRWAEVSCPADGRDEVPGEGMVGQMMGDPSNDPVQFGLVPIWKSAVWLESSMVDLADQAKIVRHSPLLCAGTPIHFTQYTVTGRLRYNVRLENFRLPPMQGAGDSGMTGLSF